MCHGWKSPVIRYYQSRGAFRADNRPQTAGADAVPVDGKRVKLPVIGWAQMREAVRFQKVVSGRCQFGACRPDRLLCLS